MVYALDSKGVKIEAARGRKGVCPTCGETLVARCGDIRVWHWSHVARFECDPWQEWETEWHRSWKLLVPPDRVEVCYGEHRADILGCDDCVVELQHSAISPIEIKEREAFYGKMIWLLDGSSFSDHFRVEKSPSGVIFSWSPPRPSWLAARKPIFVHGFSLGHHIKIVNKHTGRLETMWKPLAGSEEIFQIKTIRGRRRVTGTGRILSLDRFKERMFTFDSHL